MSGSDETETITVADVSEGPGAESTLAPGTSISLPVVELLTGRGFITGKSGSGKSNTASVVIERLLANNFPVLVVDADGEYYGLKEEFEVLHAGADKGCDIRVSPEHADKLATLALEKNVPIILDVSGFLDVEEANELVRKTVRRLFAKEKKLKKPFLLLIEECHEYIPEGGGLDETGRTLIKVGKRGRKHGLGIVGISQRPADVKKDFITQCDWLVWHRLTWDNDTKVVSRVLGAEYADAIEELDDGEAFLMTDWAEAVRRVQFHRKETFDAGATPGLDDFERPDLKSISGDLVSELEEITASQERRESKLAELRQKLDTKDQRIRELERELEEARDMRDMADRFAQALFRTADAPHRGGDGNNRAREEWTGSSGGSPDRAVASGNGPGAPSSDSEQISPSDERATGTDGGTTAEPITQEGSTRSSGSGTSMDGKGASDVAVRAHTHVAESDSPTTATGGSDLAAARVDAVPPVERLTVEDACSRTGFDTDARMAAFAEGTELRHRDAVVEGFVRAIDELDGVLRGMVRHYRAAGTATPVEAHLAAGGSGDRGFAYSRNKTLRRAGLVRHDACGRYEYALPELVDRVYGANASPQELVEVVAEIEDRTGLNDD